MKVKIKRFDTSLSLPEKEPRAACFDLICREDKTLNPREIAIMPVNIAVEVPDGYALLVFLRSSMPFRKQLMLANGAGVVDPFYNGDSDELIIELFNFSDTPVSVAKGEKVAQCMFIKSEPVEWEEVERMDAPGIGGYHIS